MHCLPPIRVLSFSPVVRFRIPPPPLLQVSVQCTLAFVQIGNVYLSQECNIVQRKDLKMAMNRSFRVFCINRFGPGPLHYISSRSDFGFEFAKIFVFEKRLPVLFSRRVADSAYSCYGESPTPCIVESGSRFSDTNISENSCRLLR
jgi:hypothetical protein